jgi:hypothetical protein
VIGKASRDAKQIADYGFRSAGSWGVILCGPLLVLADIRTGALIVL